MEASSHTTKLRMYTAKGHCITRASIRLAIGNDLVYEVVDFSSGECISGAIAKAAQGLSGKVTNKGVRKNYEQLLNQ